jgi:glycosyltransferase involved in cell wall biosynthesis
MELSILIPSTEDRRRMTDLLFLELSSQLVDSDKPVEILFDWHPTNCVGKKRNDLLARAIGKYIVFIDSDDEISPKYLSLILSACEYDADCIGINGKMTTNGYNERKWFISKDYGHWFERGGVYYRTPNHISPVKRELAIQAGFPEVSFGEDAEYSCRLLPLLQTEVIIKEPLYHYKYVSNK